jgi:hypothetical protein
MIMSTFLILGRVGYCQTFLPFIPPTVATLQTRLDPSAPLPAATAPTVAHSASTDALDAATGAALAGAAVIPEATSAKAAVAITIFFTM